MFSSYMAVVPVRRDAVLEIAQSSAGQDAAGYRAEFLDMVRRAKGLAR